jgi:hypothetical protein
MSSGASRVGNRAAKNVRGVEVWVWRGLSFSEHDMKTDIF